MHTQHIDGIIHIPLTRTTSDKHKARLHSLFRSLKLRQLRVFGPKHTHHTHTDSLKGSLIEDQEIPLEQEVLAERKLATYYGVYVMCVCAYQV